MLKKRKGPKDWNPRGDTGWAPVWPEFVDAYLKAALWVSSEPDGRPMDENFTVEDFSNEAIDKAVKECDDFVMANKADLENVGNPSSHGHDFWLSRNGHGTGFSDRGYGAVGKRLQKAARVYGTLDLYAGDDRLLYMEPI
jgi:hypothetical protein